MDPGPLVTEQIEAGAKLAAEFDRAVPLRAAFWLKQGDGGEWYFYLVTDDLDEATADDAYTVIHGLLGRGPYLWLEPLQIKIVAADSPVARGVIELQNRPGTMLPLRLRTRMVGNVYAEDGYVYPLAVPAAA